MTTPYLRKPPNELRKLTRQLRTDFETKLAEESKQKPKQLWKYVNSELKERGLGYRH